MADLLQRVEMEILNRRLLHRGEKLLVGVSGGADSMVLLHVLKALATRHRWRIIVAHFNHQLRGRAAEADEQFVRRTAARLQLPVAVGSEDVRRFAEIASLSVEMAARQLRHRFFARAAKGNKIRTVALAHHADDQVELYFLRLLRGAGSEGLAGMKWRSPSPVEKNVTLIRPLLDLTKSELLELAREHKIRFREDATNFASDIPRNRIRNELLPLLKKHYQPGLTGTVLRLMQIVGAESEFVSEVARQWMAKKNRAHRPFPPLADFENLPVAVQRRVLQLQILDLGISADFGLIESLRESPGAFVSVGPRISVARDKMGEVKSRVEMVPEFNDSELAVALSESGGNAIFDGLKFIWNYRTGVPSVGRASSRAASPGSRQNRVQKEIFDAGKIGGKVLLRHWRPGDRFQPTGFASAAKLQDLFTNAKIPRNRRHELVVAEAAGGKIFWVEGLRIGEHFKVLSQTKRCLIWRWREAH